MCGSGWRMLRSAPTGATAPGARTAHGRVGRGGDGGRCALGVELGFGGNMANIHIGVIINGATGRMGTTQHMAHLLAIAKEGGLRLKNGDRLIPELTLVGRNADSIKALAAAHGIKRATT